MSTNSIGFNRLKSLVRWLAPGVGIKRWLSLVAVGLLLVGTGIAALVMVVSATPPPDNGWLYLLTHSYLPPLLRSWLPLLAGLVIVAASLVRLGRGLVAPFTHPDEQVVESLIDHQRRSRGPNIVAIGGGTGMPNLLRGLKRYTNNITAIVTVADDGGSSGRLRRELGMLPPGDFRNNIAALSRDESLMTRLMQYRFGYLKPEDDGGPNGKTGELEGHAFGNLLLAALSGVTGGFDHALLAAERVLAMRGRVLPSTLDNIDLTAKVWSDDGNTLLDVVGESAVTAASGTIDSVDLIPADPAAYQPSVEAILQADLVAIGPGSLYTSILPNLLVAGISRALRETNALVVYISNLATQPGETDNYTVGDHVEALLKHLPAETASSCLDRIVANSNLSIPSDTAGGHTIYVLPEAAGHFRLTMGDLVDREMPWRHDGDKLARLILSLLEP